MKENLKSQISKSQLDDQRWRLVMARDPQAHTFFANIGPEQAILGRPSREDPVIIENQIVGRCIIYEIGRGLMGYPQPLPRQSAS